MILLISTSNMTIKNRPLNKKGKGKRKITEEFYFFFLVLYIEVVKEWRTKICQRKDFEMELVVGASFPYTK